MRFGRQRPPGPGPIPEGSTPVARPGNVLLYSSYLRTRPADPRPMDTDEQHNPFWGAMPYIDPLPGPVRHKLALAMERHGLSLVEGATVYGRRIPPRGDVMGLIARERLVEEWGDLSLRGHPYTSESSFQRLTAVVLDGDAAQALDVVGAWTDAYAKIPGAEWPAERESAFLDAVAAALLDTKFAVRGRDVVLRVDLGAAVLVDAPTRLLLTENPRFAPVDDKLREALSEIDAGRTADAVTDGGTALQLLLAELGHPGATLGDQVKRARKAGLFAGVDTKLGDALEAACQWVASVRNQMGDAHPGADPTREDAQFLVRIVGLLLLRWGRGAN